MGACGKKIEAAAYAGERRPRRFIAVTAILILAYAADRYIFPTGPERSAAGWLTMVAIPVGWAIKAALITFNAKGRQTVSAASGDKG